MRIQRKCANEALALLPTTGEVEAEYRAGTSGQVLGHQGRVSAVRQSRIAHPEHLLMSGQVLGDCVGVFDMLAHPERQSLDALGKQERVERAHGGAKIPQRFRPQLHQVAVDAEGLVERQPVVGVGGFRVGFMIRE